VERGPERLAIRELAARSAVTATAIYYYWPDQESPIGGLRASLFGYLRSGLSVFLIAVAGVAAASDTGQLRLGIEPGVAWIRTQSRPEALPAIKM
jgi:AcrR family transcriptional regulator